MYSHTHFVLLLKLVNTCLDFETNPRNFCVYVVKNLHLFGLGCCRKKNSNVKQLFAVISVNVAKKKKEQKKHSVIQVTCQYMHFSKISSYQQKETKVQVLLCVLSKLSYFPVLPGFCSRMVKHAFSVSGPNASRGCPDTCPCCGLGQHFHPPLFCPK